MTDRAKSLWLNLSQSLGFVPGVIVVSFAALGIGLVELDKHLDLNGVQVIFAGDGGAARTVLSVIAGSLITVAGLTFSITMVVLQLASSQFSPRVLRTFFGDRVTQMTIGIYVGTFVYAILVLRAVGSFEDADFVPRLSVTLASLLGIAAVVLLVVFLNHVSLMIQVSHVTARIAHQTLARTAVLYPEGYGEAVEDEDGAELLESWRVQAAGQVRHRRPGYVQRVALDDLAERLGSRAGRVAILVCPGDFVSIDTPIAEVWPSDAAERCSDAVVGAVSVAAERDLDQDVDFGLRQLADTAMKAMSPGINDPATAVTCVGYLRAILVRLTEVAPLPRVRRFPDAELTMITRRRSYPEFLESLLQVSRYAAGDAWVIGGMLQTLAACARSAHACEARDRLPAIREAAAAIVEQAAGEVKNQRDRRKVEQLGREVGAAAQLG